ncbi:hypothetical protein [Daejeonella sp. H1SJ63]|uniref:hypothetical protein n=1 Tax=Daejeonella sp. H1SJ63 TaxID=3034145 RepID=UPI0023EB08C4|nr:hypothetical protein [Daejeonella sp. H1SJ63]
MSIIASLLTEEVFYIATDSICCTADESNRISLESPLVNLSSKISYHPHLKTCVVGLGSVELYNRYNRFISDIFCLDITDLYDQTKAFVSTLDLSNEAIGVPGDNVMGLMAILGYSTVNSKMVAYTVTIMKTGDHKFQKHETQSEDGGLTTLISPRLKNINDSEEIILSALNSGGNIKDALVQVAKQMHVESRDPELHKFHVGGEIHFTTIGYIDGEFFFNSSTPYTFPDYDKNVALIVEYRKAIEKISEEMKEAEMKENRATMKALRLELNNCLMSNVLDEKASKVKFEKLDEDTLNLIGTQNDIMKKLHVFSLSVGEKLEKLLFTQNR